VTVVTPNDNEEPVLVTGATGRIGRKLVAELVEHGVPVRALARNPAAAAFPANVDVVAGDFTEPDSLLPALEGVRKVFLLWTAPIDTAAAVIERVASQPRRVVFLSSQLPSPRPVEELSPPARLKVEIERLLAAAGLESTFIRPGTFAANTALWWGPTIRADGVVRWTYGAAEMAPIDERDIAAVAARTLYEDGHVGRSYVLTGPEVLSQAQQASVIGDVVGRHVRFEELSPEEFRRDREGSWPAPLLDMLLGSWAAATEHPALVTSTVADVVGRPGRTYRQWVSDNADAFRAS
jgi:uncharacterized protein YbjT (DUF2867 family)